ncbi:hypothetical protein HDU98_008161 [Podochytrium sp. JEL0797]|nr:hypothetical protein HDU98_008161 [Podochytrium sp. JEL0797]
MPPSIMTARVAAAQLEQAVCEFESSPPGLGLPKETVLHLLYLSADFLSASNSAAVKRTATNPAEHPYIRGAAFTILGRHATKAVITVKRSEQAISVLESMSPAELDAQVWSLPQPGVSPKSMSMRENLSSPHGWLELAKDQIRSRGRGGDGATAAVLKLFPFNPDQPLSSYLLRRVVHACVERVIGTSCENCEDTIALTSPSTIARVNVKPAIGRIVTSSSADRWKT